MSLHDCWVAVDNGCSGTIAIIKDNDYKMFHTHTKLISRMAINAKPKQLPKQEEKAQ